MNDRRDVRLGLGIAVVVAMLGVYAGYYLVHKPVYPAQAAALGATILNVAVASLLTLLGGGLGRWLLRQALAAELPDEPGVRAVLAVALGWGVIGLGVLGLGLVGLLYSGVAWAGLLILLAWHRHDLLLWAQDVAQAVRRLSPAEGIDRVAALFVLLALALGALQAAAPPLKWDALVYHLALPRLYAQRHDVYVPLTDFTLFTGMPQLGEMLFTAASLLRLDPLAGSIAAQLVGWFAGALVAVGLAAGARSLGLAMGGWLAPALLFSSFSVAAALAWAYVELLLMLMALAMLLALSEWRRHRTARWLALAGVCGGLAFGCKYTGFIVTFGGLAVVAHALWTCPEPEPRLRRAARIAGTFIAPAAFVAAPWLLKNLALTGSPVYPLLLPAADMDAARQWFYHRPDLAERNLLSAALIFWRAAFQGVQGGNNFDVTLGPLLVLLPGALALGWRQLPGPQRAALAPLAAFTGAAYVVWVLLLFQSSLAAQARLFFAALPALALLGAGGWPAIRRLDTVALRVSLVVTAGLVLALALSALELASHFAAQQPLAYLAGHQPRQDYEVSRLGWYPLAMKSVNALPAGARVQFLWEPRSLACAAHVQCVPDVVIDRWWHLRQSGAEAAGVLHAWQRAGVTHVLLYEGGLAFVADDPTSPFTAADWDELDRLRARLTEVDEIGGVYRLYALP